MDCRRISSHSFLSPSLLGWIRDLVCSLSLSPHSPLNPINPMNDKTIIPIEKDNLPPGIIITIEDGDKIYRMEGPELVPYEE